MLLSPLSTIAESWRNASSPYLEYRRTKFLNEIILRNKNGEVLASSLEIAEKFQKENKIVNRAIRNLMEQNCTVKNMFVESTYITNRGRKEIYYEMNRDGFSLLVMGFTGQKALEWKLKYIEAFNAMEEKLKQGDVLTEEERLKLQLFSKDVAEVAYAHNRLVEIATAPLIPKAEFHDAVAVSENCINFGKFAGSFQNNNDISFGRNKIMQWCRDRDYLCSSTHLKNKPSQQMIDAGYMQYKENVDERNGKQYVTIHRC